MPFETPATFANSTMPRAPFGKTSVALVEHVAVDAMCLSGSASREASPSKEIRSGCDWLKMFGIHAGSHSTEMIQHEAIRHRPDAQFITKPMCTYAQ